MGECYWWFRDGGGNGDGIVNDNIDSEHGNANLDKSGAGDTTVQRKATAQRLNTYRQCTYKISVRRICATIGAVEKQWVIHNLNVCICNHRYPACNAHALYCHLWPTLLCSIFPHFLVNGTVFKKTLLYTVYLIFCTNFVWNISHSKKKWERYDHICILVFT